MIKKTYLDSSLLIAAWQGTNPVGARALAVLDDPGRRLIVSDAGWLEVMPKAMYHKQQLESDFYQAIFDTAEVIPWRVESLRLAQDLAKDYGIAAMDAIHVALAIAAAADELVSGERPAKPMFRVTELTMTSIR